VVLDGLDNVKVRALALRKAVEHLSEAACKAVGAANASLSSAAQKRARLHSPAHMDARPGLGWTSTPRRVVLHPTTIPVEYGDFPGKAPAELVNLALGADAEVVCSEVLSESITKALRGFFDSPVSLAEELAEFLTLRHSNGRTLKWNVMSIKPNSSFKLHAHQNIELILVLQGAMHEIRLVSPPPQTVFSLEQKDGPNLTESLHMQFERFTTYAPAKPLNQNSAFDLQSSFLLNPKGSIHLSYTAREGATLLVLWSGSHGNIPLHQYPPQSGEVSVFSLPDSIVPF
jgi:hypothetical protein